MKILTLNLHCFAETDIQSKQALIVNEIVSQSCDVIFLQEVAQSKTKNFIDSTKYIQSIEIREDNYAYSLLKSLQGLGLSYYMVYSVSNEAFGEYDEGLAILSKNPFLKHDHTYVSKTQDYNDWKTRKIIFGDVQFQNQVVRLICVHLGWADEVEVFEYQFKKLLQSLDLKLLNIVSGDFNVSDISSEYEYTQMYLYDVIGSDKKTKDPTHGDSRIDFIMTSKPTQITHYHTLFKTVEEQVSDHRGILVTLSL